MFKFLSSLFMPRQSAEPEWLELARSELGTREVEGSGDNPRIVNYFADVGRPDIKDDEVSWCAAAVGSWLIRTGWMCVKPAEQALLAQSYRTFGKRCKPQPGAIGIWPRGNVAWQGHVAIVETVNGDGTVGVIGGNQSNAVTRARFNISTALDFRWPTLRVPHPHVELANTSRKANVLLSVKRAAQATTTAGATAAGGIFTMENLGLFSGWVDTFKPLGTIALVFGVLVLGYWLLSRWLLQMMVSDVNEGRYVPSGAETIEVNDAGNAG